MFYQHLPHTDLHVSRICLGTMTFGIQNSEAEAHQQLDYAVSRGINFIDTAEMYPVPPSPETQGLTEQYIGSWLAGRGDREQLVLASKVAAPSGPSGSIRPDMKLDHANIEAALNASLERLGTDYLDLYQVHWPERKTNFFGQLGYQHSDDDSTDLLETLQALAAQVKAGKVRYIGISNETPWGAMRYLQLAAEHDLPRMVTIQNPYNLLNRTFEIGLAEIAHREGMPLLAYSPLAFGALSGKYLGGNWPEGARMTLYKRFARYFTPQGIAATQAYVELAQQHGMDAAQMALAFVNSRSFLGANIIGATTLEQLERNIDSATLELGAEVLEAIDAIHTQIPNPCP